MNKLLIGDCVCFYTDKTTINDAIDELFDGLVESGIKLDINICSNVELRNENYEIIEDIEGSFK